MWPMYVYKGGALYGSCPGKATWDYENRTLFDMLVVSAETGTMLYNGGISDQPDWYIELLGWFVRAYGNIKFVSQQGMIWGSNKKQNSSLPGPQSEKRSVKTRRR